MKLADIMESLYKQIRELLEDKEEIEENSTSAATPGFLTPNAFKGNPEDEGCDHREKMNHD